MRLKKNNHGYKEGLQMNRWDISGMHAQKSGNSIFEGQATLL